MNLKGKRVLVRIGKKIHEGKITNDTVPNKNRPQDPANHLEITTKNGKKVIVNRGNQSLAILVPKKEIHKPWREVLLLNQNRKIAIAYANLFPTSQTLVCTKTLGRLQSVIKTEEITQITSEPKENQLFEAKPYLHNTDSDYKAGNQTIAIQTEVNTY